MRLISAAFTRRVAPCGKKFRMRLEFHGDLLFALRQLFRRGIIHVEEVGLFRLSE